MSEFRISFIILLLLAFRSEMAYSATFPAPAISLSIADTIPKNQKILLVSAANAGIWTGSYIVLNSAWYRDYPREGFHFFDDNTEWNQVDKLGHVWTSYQVSRVANEWWAWTGIDHQRSASLGALTGIGYMCMIEILDGYSTEWGFSWGDMAGNFIGATGFLAQQLAWKEQRLQVKFSYNAPSYPNDLLARRNQLFGEGSTERILKDYNGQTYWLSVNPNSFFKSSSIPKWLSVSFGYSAEGMLSGRNNTWRDASGNLIDRTDIQRTRSYLLSLDLDLTRIRTRNKYIRGLLFALNMIKIPSPTLELKSNGRLRAHALYF